MQQRHVGRSGLRVSRTGLGTMTWGRDTDRHEAAALLADFTDAGGTLLDTGDAYGDAYGDGAAEVVLGELVGEVVRRDEVVLVTKAGAAGPGRRPDTSRRGLLASLDASLDRLGTDHVDLWLVAGWDPATPLEETLAAADTAVSSGRTRYLGLARHTGWQTAAAACWQRAVPG
ncbi:MAG: aldo/keto reductase, partial [Actinomycetes bacterium]